MKITIKGTEKEIQIAKDLMENTCIFNSEYCDDRITCKECEKKHVEIEYKVEE